MQDIRVTRYSNPNALGWAGYIEPADRSWIAFIGLDGLPRFHLHRDPDTHAVLPDDPDERAAHLPTIRAEGGLRTGMLNDGSSTMPAGEINPLRIGDIIMPLGVRGE